ncbi:MAG: Ig-like domain-containing protein [Candidatus Bipolaricaulis sp.]|nr:Ig-like domain-containing protein [Candidatus Bipolaricaulis sp.]
MGTKGRFGRRILVLGLVLACAGALAASGADNYPSCKWNCNAKDAEIVRVYAEASGGSCVLGEPTTITIYVSFVNHTGSTDYAIRVLADLYVNGTLAERMDECLGDAPPGTSVFVAGFYSIACSSRLELRNVVVSYSTNRSACADAPSCGARAAHCWTGAGPNRTVPIVNEFLLVDFTAPSSLCLGALAVFTDTTTGGKTPYRYLWDFGDGSTSTQASPSHKYLMPGDYTVSLTVTDASGAMNTARRDVVVAEPPVATADNGGPYCPGQTIELYADGGVSYRWTGPSGFSSSLQNPTIPRAAAANAGTYAVTVTDAFSCTSQASTVVSLDSTPPTLSIPPDATVECDEAYDPSVAGEATASDNEDPAPTVTYADLVTSGSCGGAKRVQRTWTATDECGNRSTGLQTVTLIDTTPPSLEVSDATFECDGVGNASDIAAWLASANAADACGSVTVTNDFDGVSARCSGTGTATVTFTATDACGNATDATATLRVVDSVAPDAVDDPSSTPEDSPVLINVLGNDSDRCQGDVTIVSVTSPTFGDATIVGEAIEYTPSADSSGTAEFRYTIEDCVGHRDVALVRVTVTPVNDAPTATDQTGELGEDGTLDLWLEAEDLDGDAMTYSIAAAPVRGVLVDFDPGTGAVTYIPDADYYGIDSFTFVVCDPWGACDTGTVTLVVRPANDAPTATDETETVSEDALLALSLVGTDPDDDDLTFAVVTGPAHGALVGFDPATGTVTYVPEDEYSGPDSFTFSVCDPSGACDTGTVTIAVTLDEDQVTAVDQAVTLYEDESVALELTAEDSDGDVLPLTILAGPSHGVLVGFDSVTGAVTYVPDANYSGPDTFTFTACDPSGPCDTGTISLTVLPRNDAPDAVDQTDTLGEDGSLAVRLAGTDADGDALAFAILASPVHGTLSGFDPATGAATYSPAPNYNGPDSFTFTVCDSSGACDTGTVTLSVTPVNDPPAAVGIAGTLNEDASLALQLEGTDPDGDVLTFAITTGPTHGTLLGFDPATGAVTYDPAPDYYGPDSFSFTVCGPTGACDTGTVTLGVAPVNDPPLAATQDVWTREDTGLSIQLAGSDVDGDALTFAILSSPTHATLVGFNQATGRLTYVPEPNYDGLDVLTFTVCDTAGACSQATVTIDVVEVDDPPVASDAVWTTFEDEPTGFLPLEIVDPDDAPADLVYTNLQMPLHGALEWGPDRTLQYTPDPDWFGTDNVSYEVCDPAGAFDTARITILVRARNDAPSANDDSLTVSGTEPSPVTLTGSDLDGDALAYRLLSLPEHGTIVDFGEATGVLTYVADSGYSGADAFTFEVCDPSGACDAATIDLLVVATAHAPVAEPQDVSTFEETPLEIVLRATDVDGDAITYSILSLPAHGRIEALDATTGELIYVPTRGFDGEDVFSFEACDPLGACVVSLVTVSVLPVNNPPEAVSRETTVTAGVEVDIPLSARDPDGDLVTFSIVQPPSHGAIVEFDPATGAFVVLPDEGYAGPDVVIFRVCDPSGACADGIIQTFAVRTAGGGGAIGACDRHVVVSEVAWAGTAADPENEWIELRNVEDSEIDLAGWTLRWRPLSPSSALDGFWRAIGLSGTVEAFSGSSRASAIAAGGGWFLVDVRIEPTPDVVLLERATDDAVSDVGAAQVYADVLALGRRLDLPDAGGVMELVDPYGCIVDRVGQVGQVEGWPAGDAVPSSSMQRDERLLEVAGAEWSTNWGPLAFGHDKSGNLILGTPGAVNPPPIDEILRLLPAEGARAIPIGTVLAVALPGNPSAWTTGPAMVRLTDRARGGLAIPANELLVEMSVVGGAATVIVGTSDLPAGEYALWVRNAAGMVYTLLVTVLP